MCCVRVHTFLFFLVCMLPCVRMSFVVVVGNRRIYRQSVWFGLMCQAGRFIVVGSCRLGSAILVEHYTVCTQDIANTTTDDDDDNDAETDITQ